MLSAKEPGVAELLNRMEKNNISRRDFISFCTTIAATMGLPMGMAPAIAEAIAKSKKPSVIWLSLQQCTGCSESLLRATHPTIENLILDMISLDYHETLSVAAGHQAEQAMQAAIKENSGKFVLVVDGSVPLKDGGIYMKLGGRPGVEVLREVAEKAGAIISIGSCASWGGVAAADPNPTGAVGVPEALKGKTVVTIPGCPPNPYNFLSTVIHFLTFKKLPELDEKGRPKFAYGRIIHENCERRAHFDAGRFALEFGDEGHRKGYCLYKLGCKGPETYANCPSVQFGDVGCASWPVGTGHPCFGCTEEGVGFHVPLHALARLKNVYPPANYPDIIEEQGSGASIAATALLAGIGGAAIGAGAVFANNLGKDVHEKIPGTETESTKGDSSKE